MPNRKAIECTTQRVGVPVAGRLAGHQANGGGMVVVVVCTAGVAIAQVKLAQQLGVAVLAAALFAGVEDRYLIQRIIPTFKRIDHIRDGRAVEEVGLGQRLQGSGMQRRGQ